MYAREYRSLGILFFVADVVHERVGVGRELRQTGQAGGNCDAQPAPFSPTPGLTGAKGLGAGPGWLWEKRTRQVADQSTQVVTEQSWKTV